MTRVLSSRLTFFYKKIFPAAWITVFAAVTLFLWIGACEKDASMKWFALISLIGGPVLIRRFSGRLKAVSLQGDCIVVSDYHWEEMVPLSQIEAVTETRLWNPKVIKLRLIRPGRWGNEIVFIAPVRFQFVFSNHPLVKGLRDMIRETRRGLA